MWVLAWRRWSPAPTVLYPSDSADVVQIHLDIPLEVCIERNSTRTAAAKVPEDTIRSMAARFEPPTEWWEAATITLASLPGSKDIWDEILSMRDRSREIVEEWRRRDREREIEERSQAMDRQITLESFLHNLDLALRKVVGSAVGRVKVTQPQKVAEAALPI